MKKIKPPPEPPCLTLGPCHFCEHPITHTWTAFETRGKLAWDTLRINAMRLTCDLCVRLLIPGGYRQYEDEHPACAI